MVRRWTRKALVLSLAALGVRYARMIARILAGKTPAPRPPTPIPDGPLLIRGTPRVGSTPLEPHGAL